MATLAETFASEAEDTLGALDDGLCSLRDGARDPELINTLFRAAHNLKGSAHVAGYPTVGELAHVVEELLSRWRDARLFPTRNQCDWAVCAVGLLREEIKRAMSGNATQSDTGGAAQTQSTEATASLRIARSRLDEIMTIVAELVIHRARMEMALRTTGQGTTAALVDVHAQGDHLHRLLQERVMGLRLLPLLPLFQRMSSVVAQITSQTGKRAALITRGGDLELDAAILEGLRDPLTHMIRNAVDHGIEPTDARIAAGKPAAGTVTLEARRDGGSIVIVLADDGAGLRKEKLLAKAAQLGLSITEANYTDVIFAPGFSTATEVTAISGRGVGMDVVRRNIEGLRGSVTVHSQEGHGTRFELRLPAALSLMNGFRFGVGEQSFVVDENIVTECVALPDEIVHDQGTLVVFRHRGAALPALRLGPLFGLAARSPKAPQSVVVTKTSRGSVGLVVDALHGAEQTVVKPLGPMFRDLPALSGASVTGSGDVALVLEIDRLLGDVTGVAALLPSS